METQRPVPWRADSIGPWLDALGFLSWLGSLTTAALVYLFCRENAPAGTLGDVKGWGLLLTMFFAEHIYLAVKYGVNKALSKVDSPGMQKERADRYSVNKLVAPAQPSPYKLTNTDNTLRKSAARRRPRLWPPEESSKENQLLRARSKKLQESQLCTATGHPKKGSGSANKARLRPLLLDRTTFPRYVFAQSIKSWNFNLTPNSPCHPTRKRQRKNSDEL